MKAVIVNVGRRHDDSTGRIALNVNDKGEVYLRKQENGNVWEQWTFDVNDIGHISSFAKKYKVLDADKNRDNGKVKANDGNSGEYQNWKVVKADDSNEKEVYHIIHMMDGLYLDAPDADRVTIGCHNYGNPYQQWQVIEL